MRALPGLVLGQYQNTSIVLKLIWVLLTYNIIDSPRSAVLEIGSLRRLSFTTLALSILHIVRLLFHEEACSRLRGIRRV